MATIRFSGRYLPSTLALSLDRLDMTLTEGEFAGSRVEVSFGGNNTITVSFDVKDGLNESEISAAWMQSNAIVKGALDFAAFSGGAAISYSLDLVESKATQKYLMMRDERLRAQLSSEFLTSKARDVLRIIGRNPHLRLMLADLNEAIAFPPARLINCARAIETIRNHISPDMPRGDGGWRRMREHLQVSKAYLQSITDPSKRPRHGDRTAAPDDITDAVMQRTWRLTGRFFEYLLNSSHPLDAQRFPPLDIEQ